MTENKAIDDLPKKIVFIKNYDGYLAGEIITLFYEGTNDAMYKLSGAIFGISTNKAKHALMNGYAKEYLNQKQQGHEK